MSKQTFNLLEKNGLAPVKLSNGILVHNQVDLDALGLGPYKKYFNKSETSTNATNLSTESTLSVSGIKLQRYKTWIYE